VIRSICGNDIAFLHRELPGTGVCGYIPGDIGRVSQFDLHVAGLEQPRRALPSAASSSARLVLSASALSP
jgi:hypothetical protein